MTGEDWSRVVGIIMGNIGWIIFWLWIFGAFR